jgi:hypothetical protein
MSDTKISEARAATEELAELKRRIKVTRPALQAVRQKPKNESSHRD